MRLEGGVRGGMRLERGVGGACLHGYLLTLPGVFFATGF